MHVRQAGLSLIELMIAITLGLILMTGVVQVFLSSKTVFSTQQAMSRIQETGRLAINFMARDIRMAAYYGCFRPNPSVPGGELEGGDIVVNGLYGSFDEGVRGYESIEVLPDGVASVGVAIKPLVAKTANVLVLRTANEEGLRLNKENDTNGFFAYSADPADAKGCVAGMCLASAVVVSDCFKARVFPVVAAPGIAGTEVNLRHNAGWDVVANPKNNYVSGEISAMNSVVYFLAEGPTGTPSLWQKTNAGLALELLEGVEHMRITYATSVNQTYRIATDLTPVEWSEVSSIRLELVVRSLNNNVVETTQPYIFAGALVNPPSVDGVADRYLRQVFTSTVTIRSRLTNI